MTTLGLFLYGFSDQFKLEKSVNTIFTSKNICRWYSRVGDLIPAK
jgi:hypothetical protein